MPKIIMHKFYLLIVFLFLTSCDEKNHVVSGKTMGTTYTVKTIGIEALKEQIDDRLKQLEKTFSTWDKNSELSLLNQKQANKWLDVSDELFFVLKKSREIYLKTNGFFDVGIGRLIDVWGFGSKEILKKPNIKKIQTALELSSIKHLLFRKGQVKKLKDIKIDLSAIAKGFAVDEIAKLLKNNKITKFLVEIGGEIKTSGKVWKIGVEKPDNSKPLMLELENQAVATSGNYRNYIIWQEKKYQHILNPKTGKPSQSDLSSVSVINNSTMLSDAYATAMLAMGSSRAKILAKELNLHTILILDKQHNFETLSIIPFSKIN